MSNLKPYIRKLFYLIGVIMVIGILVILNNMQRNELCTDVKLKINAELEERLINEELVNTWLSTIYPGGLTGNIYSDIDIFKIEEFIEDHDAVSNCEVSIDLNGVLFIEIDQRTPVLRILNGNQSYYLDRNRGKIEAKGLQTARVPVATNIYSDTMIKKVYTLSTYVYENQFMKALTEQIFVGNDGDLILVPKVFQQQIIVGDTQNLDKKFEKLEYFYRKGLNNVGWDKYKTINLKFENQVVCN